MGKFGTVGGSLACALLIASCGAEIGTSEEGAPYNDASEPGAPRTSAAEPNANSPASPLPSSGSFPDATTTGITDYWCPRWDELKTTGQAFEISDTTPVEYMDLSGQVNVGTANATMRCTKVTGGQTAIRCSWHDSSCGAGTLVEDVHGVATSPGGGGTFNFEAREMTLLRSKTDPSACDGSKWSGGLMKDNYFNLVSNQVCNPGAHADGLQSSETFDPMFIFHNTFLTRWQNDPSPNASGALFVTSDYGFCWGDPEYTAGYWIEDNYISGATATVRMSWKSRCGPAPYGRFANNTLGANEWVNEPINWGGGPPDCAEYVDNVMDDGNPIPHTPPAGVHSSYGACGSIPSAPTWNVSALELSSTSCSTGQASCNGIDITATASGSQSGGSPRWRYNCGGSPANTSASPCPNDCTYQDGGADLWYPHPACDGQTTCTFADVCDFGSEGTGTYTVKVHADPGPGAGVRPTHHAEAMLTVN